VKACGQGQQAIAAVVPASPLRDALIASLGSDAVDLRRVLSSAGKGDCYDLIVSAAAALNTPLVAAKATAEPRYRAEAQRPPRRIGRRLAVFDCINCDKCLPACPNDANFVYQVEPFAASYAHHRLEGGRVVAAPGGRFEVRERHQIATYQDFCNDCGNCDTFCPEDGGPYQVKPRFFGSLEAFRRLADRDGFFVERRAQRDTMWSRLNGVEYRLEVDRSCDRAVCGDGRLSIEARHSTREPLGVTAAPDAAEGHSLDGSVYLTLAVILDGVLDARRTNPVNA
jgi:putative selenate reductase